MDNLRFAIWFGLLCAAFALATFMTVYLTISL